MLAASPFLANSQQYYLFLILPFIFFVLAFSNIENHLGISREASYLRKVVYPRIREIIVLLGNDSHNFGLNTLDFEDYWVKHNLPFIMTLPVSASSYGLHILFSIIPVLLFFYYKQGSMQIYSPIEVILITIDVLGFVVLIIFLIYFRVWTLEKRKDA